MVSLLSARADTYENVPTSPLETGSGHGVGKDTGEGRSGHREPVVVDVTPYRWNHEQSELFRLAAALPFPSFPAPRFLHTTAHLHSHTHTPCRPPPCDPCSTSQHPLPSTAPASPSFPPPLRNTAAAIPSSQMPPLPPPPSNSHPATACNTTPALPLLPPTAFIPSSFP